MKTGAFRVASGNPRVSVLQSEGVSLAFHEKRLTPRIRMLRYVAMLPRAQPAADVKERKLNLALAQGFRLALKQAGGTSCVRTADEALAQ